jgi:cytochrome d ubiquinol oxidase subunit II
MATPLAGSRVFDRWFSLPNLLWLAPIPILTMAVFYLCDRSLKRLRTDRLQLPWMPFSCAIMLFVLAFVGLAYSLFPYLVVDRITYLEAATAPESLRFMLVGIVITLPAILGYTAYSYRVFWGKTRELAY